MFDQTFKEVQGPKRLGMEAQRNIRKTKLEKRRRLGGSKIAILICLAHSKH